MQTQDIVLHVLQAVLSLVTFFVGQSRGKKVAAEEAAKNKQA